MSETSGGIRGTALGIVVEQYEKSGLRRLTGATEQMRELCELLEGHGYTARMLTDPGWKAVREPVRDWAVDWGRGGRHGPAVVVWSGHGKLDDGELRLMLGDTENPEYEGETFSANELTATALLSRADQVLLLIDTCHAGAGVGESLKKALTKLSAKNLPRAGRRGWACWPAAAPRRRPRPTASSWSPSAGCCVKGRSRTRTATSGAAATS